MNGRMVNMDQLSVKFALSPNIPHALWSASKEPHVILKSQLSKLPNTLSSN